MNDDLPSLDIRSLHAAYRAGTLTPRAMIDRVLARIAAQPERNAWIHRLDRDALMACADRLEGHSPDSLPLYGVPFAVKDNIDLAGVPTTAACPAFAHTPDRSAFVVEHLIAAGAIPLGKTNLDQFATGLVGHALALRGLPQRLRPALHLRRLQRGLGGDRGHGCGELLARH
jgi:allophanate hydrolase